MHDKPFAIARLLDSPATVLDYYLQLDDLSCCSVLGGFIIFADGKVAMGLTDEVQMSNTWLPAIIRLQRGESRVSVWPWEESSMTLTRKGELVEMKDVHHSGNVVCARVRFRFREFVWAMLDSSRPMAAFVEAFQAAIDDYLSDSTRCKDAESIDRLKFLRETFTPEWASWIAESEALLASNTPEQ